jgi:hypothetical protein
MFSQQFVHFVSEILVRITLLIIQEPEGNIFDNNLKKRHDIAEKLLN